ncbi:RNA-directed DNA polymerase, eukaryota, partial [Tanacetum coccineum]
MYLGFRHRFLFQTSRSLSLQKISSIRVSNTDMWLILSSLPKGQKKVNFLDSFVLSTSLTDNLKNVSNNDKRDKVPKKSSHNAAPNVSGNWGNDKSFVNVVKGGNISVEMESTPSIVLDDECLNTKDFSCYLMGRVNEFSSLSNLKKVLGNEGFDALKISYLGELWVLLEFESVKVKDLFKENGGANSWFSVLIQATEDFTPEGRIVWMEVEGIPLKFWSDRTFLRIASKWGKLLEIDDYDDMNFYSKRLCIITKVSQNILESFKIVFRGKVYWLRAKEVPGWTPEFSEDEDEEDVLVEDNLGGIHSDQEINNGNEESNVEEVLETVFGDTEEQKENPSEDPFGIYPLLNKDKNVREHETNEEESSLKHPPGFTPDLNEGQADGGGAKLVNEKVAEDVNSFVHTVGDKANSGSVNNMSGSMGSCHLKKSGRPRSGCSILSVMEEIIKVGLTQKAKKDWVRELCIKNKVNFVGLQETKMEYMDLFSVRSCWGNPTFDYVHSDSVGNSGGILCIWDPNSFCMASFTRSDYFVIIRGKWLKSGIDLIIGVVYAPQEAKDKRMLWDYLSHVSGQWDGEIVMMGDFNEARHKSERFGSIFKPHDADIFNSFIHNLGLYEVHLGGSAFTWCHKSATKMNHRPILLREVIFDYGPCPFRFYNYWLEVDGFDKLVRDAWNDAPGNKKNAIRNFMYKLKYTKEQIRGWLPTYRLYSRGELPKLKEDLRLFDEAIDEGKNSDEIVHKRLETFNKIQQVNNTLMSEAVQKAKIKWVADGDENTKFFHGMINKKRSQMSIRGIMVNGTWIDNPVNVKYEFLDHFRRRFDKPSENRAMIDICFPKVLSIEQRDDLERMVTKEEVKQAVWDCGCDKSPGPDGFSFSFFRHFWSTIEKDMFEAVDCFFTNGDMPNGCNSNFIALIPKIIDANMVKDFRPISLIGSLYKVIAKVLTNRLTNVIGDLVNEVQSAFVAERQILDGPFILNEVLQWCRSKKKQALIFKVDFEKAYDSVRWDFIDDLLHKFGFGNKWRTWIQSCLRSSRGSILVNGSTTEEFQFFKGLKQGDPLSPFLFILIMESLHISFQRVVDAGLFSGINLNSMVNLSHLFYADDAIFIGQWSETNIDTLVQVLECFYRASGMRINMCKSKIMGTNVDDGKVQN